MKVLYIGHYKENSETGRSIINKILALDSTGIEVVCRNYSLGVDNKNIPSKILELERRDSSGCDICIQHVLPHCLVGSDLFKKNIAILETDIGDPTYSAWTAWLKLVDQIWVPNADMYDLLKNFGFDVQIVHNACDYDKFTRRYQGVNIPETVGRFKFYFIGDISDANNIDSVLTCFHSEFDKAEPVSLILKVGKFGHTPQQTMEVMNAKVNDIKRSIRIYPEASQYINEIIIADDLSEDNICSLHQYCDCFISPTRGEVWSSNTFDAMGFGSAPICSSVGGPPTYIDDRNGSLLDGVNVSCKSADPAFPGMSTGRSYWFQPCEQSLRECMRWRYDQYMKNPMEYGKSFKLAGLLSAKKFTHKEIGSRMESLLNE